MHGNDELGHAQGAALLGVGEVPDAAEDIVGQPRLFEDLFRVLSWSGVSLIAILLCLAQGLSPERMPLCAPDFSKRPAYSAAFAGGRGGTRMGPPLICGEMPCAGGGA